MTLRGEKPLTDEEIKDALIQIEKAMDGDWFWDGLDYVNTIGASHTNVGPPVDARAIAERAYHNLQATRAALQATVPFLEMLATNLSSGEGSMNEVATAVLDQVRALLEGGE